MNSQQRVNLIFSRSGLTKTNFAKKVKLSLNHIVAAINGSSNIGIATLRKIADAHPEYCQDWVLSGYGAMLIDGSPEPSVANSVAQNDEVQDARSLSFTAHLMKQNEMLMAEKAKMLDIIMNLTAQVGKLNLQSEAGCATEVMLFPKLASVA